MSILGSLLDTTRTRTYFPQKEGAIDSSSDIKMTAARSKTMNQRIAVYFWLTFRRILGQFSHKRPCSENLE